MPGTCPTQKARRPPWLQIPSGSLGLLTIVERLVPFVIDRCAPGERPLEALCPETMADGTDVGATEIP